MTDRRTFLQIDPPKKATKTCAFGRIEKETRRRILRGSNDEQAGSLRVVWHVGCHRDNSHLGEADRSCTDHSHSIVQIIQGRLICMISTIYLMLPGWNPHNLYDVAHVSCVLSVLYISCMQHDISRGYCRISTIY